MDQDARLHNLISEVREEIEKQGFFTPLHLLEEVTGSLSSKIKESFGLTENDERFKEYLEKARRLYFDVEMSSVADR